MIYDLFGSRFGPPQCRNPRRPKRIFPPRARKWRSSTCSVRAIFIRMQLRSRAAPRRRRRVPQGAAMAASSSALTAARSPRSSSGATSRGMRVSAGEESPAAIAERRSSRSRLGGEIAPSIRPRRSRARRPGRRRGEYGATARGGVAGRENKKPWRTSVVTCTRSCCAGSFRVSTFARARVLMAAVVPAGSRNGR